MRPLAHLRRCLPPALALALAAPASLAAKKEAPPAKPAAQYAAFDSHANEHVSVAAEPCNDPKDCTFFRLPYIQHGFIPVRVIVTNDSDEPLSLDDVRMQFISADHDILPAANDDDLQRRLFTFKSVQGSRIPMPAPLPSIPVHHAPVDKKILEDENDFGFSSTTVAPHSTLAGYLFYDIRELDDPPLRNAELYVKMIHAGKANRQLFAFTVPFNKWLAARDASKNPSKDAKEDAKDGGKTGASGSTQPTPATSTDPGKTTDKAPDQP